MRWQDATYLILVFAAAAVTAALAAYAWRRRGRPGVAAFAGLMLAIAELSLACAFRALSPTEEAALFWHKAVFLGLASIPVAFLAFVLQYTGRERWLTRWRLALLCIVPAITQVVVWTNEAHGLFFPSIDFSRQGALTRIGETVWGVWLWVHMVYGYLLLLLGIGLIVQTVIRSSHLYRRQALVLLLGVIPPLAADVIDTLGPVPELGQALLPLGFALMGPVLAWDLFRYRLLELVPVARDALIDNMGDGMVVLDAKNLVVDLNAAMEGILGVPVSRAIGKSAAEVFAPWQDLLERFRHEIAAQAEISLEQDGGQRHYDLRISPLTVRRGRLAGRLIVLRDITDRVRAEKALHRAHLDLKKQKERADDLLEVVIPIGVELTSEKDFNRLLERMLLEGQAFCGADGGTLYLRTDDDLLEFAIVRNESLGIAMGGTTAAEVTLPPLNLYDESGKPNHNNVATYAAHCGAVVNIPDAYEAEEFDFSGTRAFDERTGYRSQSLLTIPLKDSSGEVIGVLQLVNAQDADTGEVIPFDQNLQRMMESFSALAVAALEAYIREQSLRREIQRLRIEVDDVRKAQQVAEITETDYFQSLRERAKELREGPGHHS